ncbi:BnaC09g23890D [Brassica napus]|uniref:BnaC09g23890D protein n=1 Tax=Brassica napus TaxID=3708 RepID=A0A078FJS9_BRANA|nr:BnaC09g23890D [Brassica napus]
MEFRSQRTNSRFPPPGSETTNQLGVALFHLYDARIHDNSSLDPDLIRSSSLSSPLSVLSSSPRSVRGQKVQLRLLWFFSLVGVVPQRHL